MEPMAIKIKPYIYWLICLLGLFVSGCRDAVPRPQHVAPAHAAIVDQLVGLNANVITDKSGHITDISFYYNHEAVNPPVYDADIACLAKVHSLESLNIERTYISDAGLKAIASLPHLQGLGLPSISDNGLRHLSNLKELQCLCLLSSKITNQGLQHLANLHKMEILDLGDTPITSDGLKYLSSMKKLGWLRISSTQVGDKGLEHLNNLPALVDLEANFTMITDDGVKRIQPLLQQLKSIRLSNTQISDQAIAPIAASPMLEELYLANTQLTDKGISQLSKLPRLKKLILNGTAATDSGIDALAGCKSLKELFLYDTAVSYKSVEKLKKKLPGIRITLSNRKK